MSGMNRPRPQPRGRGLETGRSRGRAGMVALACLSMAMTACSGSSGATGSSNSPVAGGSSGSSVSAAVPSAAGQAAVLPTAKAAVAAAEGKAAGEKLGSAKLPTLKVAYLRYVAADSADQLDYQALTAATKALGWKVDACDGQGNPTVMLSCGRSLLAQNPDVFIDDGIPGSLIGPVLQEAKSKNIPTVSFSGTLNPCAPYDACYTAPDGQMGELLASYVKGKLSSLPGNQQQMIVQTFPADWGVARVDSLNKQLAASSVKVVAKPAADATNLVAGTQQQITSLLGQYPDVRAVWVTFDGAVSGAAQAVAARFAGQKFPDAPMVVTFYQEPQTLQDIAQGKVTATVYESLGWDAFVSVDQVLEHVARGTAFNSNPQPAYPGDNLEFWQPRIIDQSNVGSASYPASPVNYAAYFAAKWKAEFGIDDAALTTALNPLP